MRTSLVFIAVVVGVMLAFLVSEYGIRKQEMVECEQWNRHAEEYPGFYYEQWQKDQCKLMEI